MMLDDIYDFLKHHGLTNSERDFSRRFLGTSECYVGYLRCRGRAPSALVVFRLSCRLWETWRDLRHKDFDTDELDVLRTHVRAAFTWAREGVQPSTSVEMKSIFRQLGD
jgi:hypothetical protein